MADLHLTDLGHIIEGTVEADPLSEKLSIRTVDAEGKPQSIDLDELVRRYAGKEVKLTLASLENLQKIQTALGDGAGVMGVMPEDVPGATFQRTFKQKSRS